MTVKIFCVGSDEPRYSQLMLAVLKLVWINGIMDTYSLDRVVFSKSARAC